MTESKEEARRLYTEGLYKLFLMGLLWIPAESLSTLGASVFASYSKAGILPPGSKTLLANSFNLAELIMQQSEIIESDKMPRKRDLLERIERSDMNSLLLVIPRGEVDLEKIIAPGGYRHVLTKRGGAVAHKVTAEFERVIDVNRFRKGWERYKAQMANMYAHTAATSGTTQQSPGEGVASGEVLTKYIPPAPNVKPEW